jgi:hypothetical protein
MRGRVKKGMGRSLGLHGIGGREGAAPMVRVACRGGGGAIAGSGWRREGERGPVTWWVSSDYWLLDGLGQKPLGRKVKQAGRQLCRLGQSSVSLAPQ